MMAGVAIWRTLGDPHAIALGLNFMVPTLNKLGKYEEAKAFLQESIALCEQSKNWWGMGTAYSFLGSVCIAEGQYAAAKTHLFKSLEIFKDYTTGWNIARSHAYLGHATRMAGEIPEARKYYLDALRTSVEVEAIPIALDALAGLASLLEQAGQVESALRLSYFILDHPCSEEETKACVEQLQAALEPKLTSEQVMSARALAAKNTLDEIVKEVLKTDRV
jgi:tetratricopeptide (TPR) repeat protein